MTSNSWTVTQANPNKTPHKKFNTHNYNTSGPRPNGQRCPPRVRVSRLTKLHPPPTTNNDNKVQKPLLLGYTNKPRLNDAKYKYITHIHSSLKAGFNKNLGLTSKFSNCYGLLYLVICPFTSPLPKFKSKTLQAIQNTLNSIQSFNTSKQLN